MRNIVEQHVHAVKREIEEGRTSPTKTIVIQTVNLDNFQFDLKGGITNVAELVEVKEFIDQAIAGVSSTIKTFIEYHKKSPRYWGQLEKCEDRKVYTISIELETFMPEKSTGKEIYPDYYLPNNRDLGKVVIKAFKKAGGDVKGIKEEHFRELATWEFKNKAKAQKLVNFIQKTYVKPHLEDMAEFYNIKKLIFTEDSIDFEYNRNKV